jgi:hypothetical protein
MEAYSLDLVRQACAVIWQLFDAGLVDEDLATIALLAITIGHRSQDQKGRTNGMSRPDEGAKQPPS